MSDPLTWRAALADATAELGDPDGRWIVEEASGHAGADLLVHLDEPATERAVAHLDDMLARRRVGEPIQYVLGHWSFRTLDLVVDRRVLIPRPETEQVVEAALAELDRRGGRDRATVVADLGTGSGAIALSLCVERPRSTVWAVERSSAAAAVARVNIAGLGRSGARVRLVEGDWFEALPDDLAGRLDLVVSNPPYVTTAERLDPLVAAWEPAEALYAGADGLDDVRRLLGAAAGWLAPGGAIVVELDPRQADAAAELAEASALVDVTIGSDLSRRPRWVRARRRAGSRR
jgi:release factor glutamine methyltransferase